MIEHRFVWAPRMESGSMGWRILSQPTFTPASPRLVAHDIIEHGPNDDGSLEDEIRAIGAVAFVRLASGAIYADSDCDVGSLPLPELAASFFVLVMHNAMGDGVRLDLKEPPTSEPLDALTYGAGRDEVLRQGLALAAQQLPRYAIPEDCSKAQRDALCSEDSQRRMLGWARLGYKEAFARYLGDPQLGAYLYNEVKSKVAKISYGRGVREGDELHVTVSPATREVTVTHLPQAIAA